jgi:sugar lactone lactonase YvrE
VATTVPKPAIHPVRWTPPPPMGLTGPYAKNDALAAAEVLPVPGEGPEDVAIAADGAVYTGTADGSILAITDDGDTIRRITRTGGRPLGIELIADDRLLVCDAERGLLAVTIADGTVEVLATAVDGVRLGVTNNAAVAPDGTIWFTDSSRHFPLEHHEGDILEHRGSGRLIRRDPDGTCTTAVDGLVFANGVALDPAGRFVLVAESGGYRILRHHLTGPDAGRTDHFADVPGFPDNLSVGPTGIVWCAVASPRNRLLDLAFDRPPVIRRIAWALPAALRPGGRRPAIVLGYDLGGALVRNLQLHDGTFTMTTGAREHDGLLYVSSIASSAILRHRL